MATASEIIAVRKNVNEPSEESFSDEAVAELIDSDGVDLASAAIWRTKAAAFSEMVDTSEAGASRKASDLFKNANAMAEHFEKVGGLGAEEEANSKRAKVHVIQRLT